MKPLWHNELARCKLMTVTCGFEGFPGNYCYGHLRTRLMTMYIKSLLDQRERMGEETKFHSDNGIMEISVDPVPVDSSSVSLDCPPKQLERDMQGVVPEGEFDSKLADPYANLSNVCDHSCCLARFPKHSQASTNPIYMGGLPNTGKKKMKKGCRSRMLLAMLFMIALIALGLSVATGFNSGFNSANMNRQRAKLNQLKVEQDEQRAELDQLKAERDQQRAELNQLKVEQDQLKAELNQLKVEQDQLKAERDQQRAELDQLRLQWQNFTDQEVPTALSGCTTIRRREFGCTFVNTMLATCTSPTTDLSPLEFTCAVSMDQMMPYGATPVPLPDGRWTCACFLIYSPHAFQNVTVPFTCDLYEKHCS